MTADPCAPGPELGRPPSRPGQPTVDYRLGDFTELRDDLLTRLRRSPTLGHLATRSAADPTMALIDGWAMVGDIVTFYQERLANESWLRTAQHRDSITRLASLIGYRPNPAVSAFGSVELHVDEDVGNVVVPAGSRVQHAPIGEEPPQTFETVADLDAWFALNRFEAHVTDAPAHEGFSVDPFATVQTTVLDRRGRTAAAATIAPGRTVVLWGSGVGDVEYRTVDDVFTDGDRTIVRWKGPVPDGFGATAQAAAVRAVRRAAGRSAPVSYMEPSTDSGAPGGIRWTFLETDFDVPERAAVVIEPGADIDTGATVLVLVPGIAPIAAIVDGARDVVAAVGGTEQPGVRLALDQTIPSHDLRRVRVVVLDGPLLQAWGSGYARDPAAFDGSLRIPAWYLDEERVVIERRPEKRSLDEGRELVLGAFAPGRLLVVAGDASAEPDVETAHALVEVVGGATIEPAHGLSPGDFCHVDVPIQRHDDLPWGPLQVAGNIVAIVHGETREETIGDGDRAVPLQNFELSRNKLAADIADGSPTPVPAISVFANGVERPVVADLVAEPAASTAVQVHLDPDDAPVVTFGGSGHAQPAPTGAANIVARYRVGGGAIGRVPSGSIIVPTSMPSAITSVHNPFPTVGGADADDAERARRDAPTQVRTLGRVVSLGDLEALTLESGLAIQTTAHWAWTGHDHAVHLTIVPPGGEAADPELLRTVAGLLDSVRDPHMPLRVIAHTPVEVEVDLTLFVNPGVLDPDGVAVHATALLRELFSASGTRPGSIIASSDIAALLHDDPSVIGIDIDRLIPRLASTWSTAEQAAHGLELDGAAVADRQPRLRFLPPRLLAGSMQGAELPVLDSPERDLTVRWAHP